MLTRRDPWGFPSLTSGFDQLFEDFFRPSSLRHAQGSGNVPMNAWEDEDAITLEAELPGISLDDLQITVAGEVLTIEGERTTTSEDRSLRLRERHAGKFRRQLKLASPIESKKIEARLVDGVLTVRLPKAEAARPRQIPVQSN